MEEILIQESNICQLSDIYHFHASRVKQVYNMMKYKLQYMRKIVILLLILISQVVNADVIKLHYGEPINCKVTEITDEYIKYILENETLIRTIGTLPVKCIEFDNGNIEDISPLIVIDDPKKDWENIVIVYDKNAVKGMVKIGEGFKKANSAWSTNTKKDGLERKVFEKLKKECAKQGGKVLLVTRKDSQSQGGFGSYGFAEINAEYYCY